MRTLSALLLWTACVTPEASPLTDEDLPPSDEDLPASDTDATAEPPAELAPAGSDLPRWSWCPGAPPADPGGDASLVVRDDALWCAVPVDQPQSWREVINNQAQILFMPGEFPLPRGNTDRLPAPLMACMQDGSGARWQTDVDSEHALAIGGGRGPTDWDIRVPWAGGRRGGLQITARDASDGARVIIGDRDPYLDDPRWTDVWSVGGRVQAFMPCVPKGGRRAVHTVDFDGGSLQIEVRRSTFPYDTAYAMFTSARLDFRGDVYEITDYWRLLHIQGQHNATGTYVILFPEPRNDVCGLRYDDGGYQWASGVSTIDCDINTLRRLDVHRARRRWIDP